MNHTLDVAAVKQAARGQWPAILQSLGGLTAEQCDPRKHQPCPKCGGKDRFTAFPDNAETGGVNCRKCGSFSDGLAALQWITGKPFGEVKREVANYLGISCTSTSEQTADIVADVARSKQMPVEAFKRFGAVGAKRGSDNVARVPVYDERGEPHSYFDLGMTGKLAKGLFKMGKGNSGLFLPGRKPQAGETWLIVEGVKDAAALVGLDYLAAGLNTCHMNAKYAALFRGAHVVLVPDLDTAGQNGASQSAARLFNFAESVRVVRLPGEVKSSDGDDVRDVLRQPDGERLVREAIESAVLWKLPAPNGSDGDRPEVELTHDENRVVANVLPALGNLGWTLAPQSHDLRTFQRSGELFHVVTDASPVAEISMPDDARRIRPLPASLLRERITAAVRLYSNVERGGTTERRTERPPLWLVNAIHERGQYARDIFRPITGVITAPTMRPDGTVIQASGYDPATGLLVELSGEWPVIPDRPTRDAAIAAADDLLEVVRDFPFMGAAHRSGWLSLVLTLVGRPAIAGPCPLFLVDANTRGSGKGLAADAAGVIASGTRLPRKTWPNEDDEVRKTITAVALEALPVVLLDNIAGRLGCASLDAALTGITWSDRILGASKTTGTLSLTTVWAATGNNIELAADTARRTLLMRLESPLENPEERSGFAHPDLLGWVRDERRRLSTAALTILRAYVAAGRHDQGLAPWGSFESWSALVRSAIVWTGHSDPADTRVIVRDADRSAELLKLVLNGIAEAGGEATSQDLLRLVAHSVGPDERDAYPNLRLAVAELCGEKPTTARLGVRLRTYLGRVCGGRRLMKRAVHGGVQAWYVESVCGGDGEDGGDVRAVTSFLEQAPHDTRTHAHAHVKGRGTSPPNPPSPPSQPTADKVCPSCHSAESLASGNSGRLWCVQCEREAVTR